MLNAKISRCTLNNLNTCFGMNTKGTLEQMVEPLGDGDVEPGVGVLQHDLLDRVPRHLPPRLGLDVVLDVRLDRLPPGDRVRVLLLVVQARLDLLTELLARDQGQDLEANYKYENIYIQLMLK